MLQLNPPQSILAPKGEGFAHVLTDYGLESDLYWTVFITATGEAWTFANREVRATKNITLGRVHVELLAPGNGDDSSHADKRHVPSIHGAESAHVAERRPDGAHRQPDARHMAWRHAHASGLRAIHAYSSRTTRKPTRPLRTSALVPCR